MSIHDVINDDLDAFFDAEEFFAVSVQYKDRNNNSQIDITAHIRDNFQLDDKYKGRTGVVYLRESDVPNLSTQDKIVYDSVEFSVIRIIQREFGVVAVEVKANERSKLS